MKLKYIIPSFIAAIAMLVGCSEDFERAYMSELNVSRSFVSIPATGGTAEITVNAAADWTIEGTVPNWLTIQPAQGQAGQTIVSFSAPATSGALSAALKIVSGSLVQEINVVQGEVVAEQVTIKQACSGDDGKTFRVTGAIVRWANNSEKYGNCYIADETGEIQIYGMADKNGKLQNYPLASWGLELGDVITVEGGKSTYKGEAELCDVTVLNVKKSLVKIVAPTKPDTLGIEGGELAVKLAFKGKGVIPTVDDKYTWIRYKNITITPGVATAVEQNPADTAVVTFAIEPNTGGDRAGAVSFTCTNGSASSTTSYSFAQKGSIIECNIADFLAAEVGDTQYRMTGVITELYNTSKGLAGFYVKDYSGQALVYQPAGFSGTEAKVGDVVTVVGKRGAYNNNPQMTGCTLEKVNYSVTEVSIAEFLTKADDKNTYYMVTGTIKSLKNNKGQDNDYGNLYLTDGTNEIYVYGTYSGWAAPKGDAQKYFIRDNGLEVGDELTMIGYKDTYNGLIEICGGTCFSFKKVQAAGAAGSKENPFTIAEAFAYIDAGGQDDVYVKGKVSKIQNEFTADNGYGTFWISEDGTYNNDLTKDFEAYRVYWFGDNKKWKEGDSQPAVGDEVIICGKLTKYTNKNTGAVTYETSQYKAYVYSLNGKTE